MKQILIVEDSKVQQTLLMGILEEQGYNADAVDDGSKAIKLATGKQYDLILLDIHLPKIDGRKVLKEIRTQGASVNAHIIMVTSDINKEVIKLTVKRGACDYIIKPFVVEMVLERVNKRTCTLCRMGLNESVLEEEKSIMIDVDIDSIPKEHYGNESIKDVVKLKLILIVDDSSLQQKFLLNILKDYKYKIDTVESGEKAIKFANEKRYDLILLDINMEGITGMTVLDKIKDGGASANANVIMITSENGDETVKAAIQRGACDYIIKPFRADKFLAKVNKWI